MFHDVRLLAIAGPPVLREPDILDACRAAAAGGVTAVQLRLKSAPASTIYRLTEALLDALEVPVFVNDRADVAVASGAHGVHLGAADVPPRAVREFAPPPFRIGVSVGTRSEADTVRGAAVDYWSIGSVYATVTKPDAGSPIGVGEFRRLAAQAPTGMPVIAIGGVTVGNAAEVLQAGAHGIAVSRAIFGMADVSVAATALRAVVESERA